MEIAVRAIDRREAVDDVRCSSARTTLPCGGYWTPGGRTEIR